VSVVYLDNNATTQPAPTVLEAWLDGASLANPASQHAEGKRASAAIEAARDAVGRATGARPNQVLITSGATESNNLAIIGTWRRAQRSGSGESRHKIAVGATEHPSVLEAAYSLTTEGAQVVELPVLPDGRLDLQAADGIIDGQTLLVSVMAANNETGVINAPAAIARTAHSHGAYFHTDATQAMGRLPVDFEDWGADLLSISGHKFHGPRGVGALIKNREVGLVPLMFGGGQERELRPGTINTAGVLGLAAACVLVPNLLASAPKVASLRDLLWQLIVEFLPDAQQNGSTDHRLSNTLNVWLPGADNEAVLAGLDAVMCSTGSACASGKPEPSHVLQAMGLGKTRANESLRFSLSTSTTESEIRLAARQLVESVAYVRGAMRRGA